MKSWSPALAVSLIAIGSGWIPISGMAATQTQEVVKVAQVKLNPHPMNLKGKRVLLRWNGRYAGDKFLMRIGELLTHYVEPAKVIEMWEVDSSTAAVSGSVEESKEIAAKIVKQRPDIVIAGHVG